MNRKNIDFNDLVRLFLKNYVYIIISVVLFTSAAFLAAFRAKKIYRVESTVMLNMNSQSSQLTNAYFPYLWNPNIIQNQIYIIKSYSLMRNIYSNAGPDIIERICRYARNELAGEPERMKFFMDFLLGSIVIKPVEDSDIIVISFDLDDPGLAVQVLDLIVSNYRDFDLAIQKEETDMIKKFLEQETEHYRDLLQESENRLKSMKLDMKSNYLGNEAKEILEKYGKFQEDYYKNEVLLAENRNHHAFLSKRIEDFKNTLGKNIPLSNERINILISKISALESDKISLSSSGYGEENEKYKEITAKLDVLYKDLRTEINSFIESNMTNKIFSIYQDDLVKILNLERDIKVLEAKEKAYKGILKDYEGELATLPQKQLEFSRIYREVELNEKIFNMLKEKLEEAKIQNEGVISKVQIIDRPVKPSGHIRPHRRNIILMGMIFGIFFGVFFILLKSYLFASADAEELKRKYSIANKMDIPNFMKDPDFHNAVSGSFKGTSGKTRFGEFLHLLKLNFGTYEKNCPGKKTVLVTSPMPATGKSTFVYLLSLALTEKSGRQVLVLDTDLRKPILHKLFGIEREKGITDIYTDKESRIEGLIRTVGEGIHFISAGPSSNISPIEVLTSQRFKDLLTYANEHYDLVLLDSPPILNLPDAISMSSSTDCVMLVISETKTSAVHAENAIREIQDHGAEISVLINNLSFKKSMEYRYGYYSYNE